MTKQKRSSQQGPQAKHLSETAGNAGGGCVRADNLHHCNGLLAVSAKQRLRNSA